MESDYAGFIRNRITDLRIAKNVSEYQMSLDLGHSKSYIQGITSGRALPSMNEFIAICDYFEITPRDFFDSGRKNPALVQKLLDAVGALSDDDIELLLKITEKFGK
ncbi:MAG: helix-turn-helix domain-containing protein [Oscillospiraceae bacterium]|nr:helix-turn-helix domain-containing protein [Oscillospiraceae bacterium]